MVAREGDGARTVEELELDCQELRTMLSQAKRANVRKELQRNLDCFEAEARRMQEAAAAAPVEAATTSAPAAAAKPATPAPTSAAADATAEKPAAPVAKPVQVDVRSTGPWTEITTFALDLGGYDKPHITIDIRLKGVELLPQESVTCDFTESSLDLKVLGLDGQNHRFLKTPLAEDIVAKESSVKVKKNHVIITLQKVKGEYGFPSWADLCAKGGRRKPKASKTENPQDSIMGMMQDLYEDGDDNMKKIIGEAMCKARRGEKPDLKDDPMTGLDPKLDDL